MNTNLKFNKMKKLEKKLVVKRETIANLDNDAMRNVVGGVIQPTDYGVNTSDGTCNGAGCYPPANSCDTEQECTVGCGGSDTFSSCDETQVASCETSYYNCG